MASPTYSSPRGPRVNNFTFPRGTQPDICPTGKKGVKPSKDNCRCCSGDDEYTSGSFTTLNGALFNIAGVSSIKLI
jgi:hypothetical protein